MLRCRTNMLRHLVQHIARTLVFNKMGPITIYKPNNPKKDKISPLGIDLNARMDSQGV